MLRVVLLILLLASLILMVRQFSTAPLPETQVTRVRSKTRPLPTPAGEAPFLKKPAVRPVPEVYKGYLFTPERKLDESDLAEFGGGGPETAEAGDTSLEGVFYAGSLIVGKLRQGLIVYREGGLPARQSGLINPTLIRPRPGVAAGAAGEQTKTVQVGDRFRGYQVVAIEPDKIVFEKGGEKVEKYLFDQSKKRLAPPASKGSTPSPGQPARGGAITPSAATRQPTARIAPGNNGGRVLSPAGRYIRSRRYPMGSPTTGLPAPPGSPNRQSVPNR